MSKSRAKKLRKRARKGAESGPPSEDRIGGDEVTHIPAPEEEFWFSRSSETRTENMKALKLELLGPFLFGQNTLCEKTVRLWSSVEVMEGGVLPMFFTRDKWDSVRNIVALVQLTVEYLEVDTEFQLNMLKYPPIAKQAQAQDDKLLVKILHSDKLKGIPLAKIRNIFGGVRSHVSDFAERVHTCGSRQELSPTLVDKERLVAPVKDRGNTNFKQDRFKAAIGDYSTAIKLCPYNPVLYCNRALCYLRNEEYWCACLDGYRAMVLRPGWEKAYYRCSEAWAKLGEPEMALEINKEGIKECREVEDLFKQTADLQANCPRKEEAAIEAGSKVSSKEGKESPGESLKVRETPPRSKKSHSKKPPLFTAFEELQCPVISSSQLSCSELRGLSRKVELNNFNPSAYFAHAYEWEKLESPARPPFTPRTNTTTIKEPMETEFDDIFCPLIADSADEQGVIPPKLSNAEEADILDDPHHSMNHTTDPHTADPLD